MQKVTRRRLLTGAGGLICAPYVARADSYTITAVNSPSLSMSIVPGSEFAAGTWPHTTLAANAPLDPNSATLATAFNNMLELNQSHSVYIFHAWPLYLAAANQPTVRVQLISSGNPVADAFMQQQFNAVPMPAPNTFRPEAIDGTVQPDAEAMIYQPSTGKYWEFYFMSKTGNKIRDSANNLVDEWQAFWGGQMNVRTNNGSWPTDPATGLKPGMVAAGINVLSFMITYNDVVVKQKIAHPVGISLNPGQNANQWSQPPAMRTDGPQTGVPPNLCEGMILRLPANIDFQQWPFTAWDGVSPKSLWRLVGEAVRDYGMVCFDQGGTSDMLMEDTTHYTPDGSDLIQNWLDANGFFNFTWNDRTLWPWDSLQVLPLRLMGP